ESSYSLWIKLRHLSKYSFSDIRSKSAETMLALLMIQRALCEAIYAMIGYLSKYDSASSSAVFSVKTQSRFFAFWLLSKNAFLTWSLVFPCATVSKFSSSVLIYFWLTSKMSHDRAWRVE